jgi:hypothetical protein
MKPSVHLQHIATGRLWVGCCTGEPQPETFIRFGCGDFWVGRDSDSEIRLDHHSVSSRHAVLRVVDARLYVNDQDSTNGTQVNDGPRQGRRGRPRAGEPPLNWIEIRPSDLLTFGEEAVRILWVGEGSSPFTPAHLAWNGGAAVKMAGAILDGAGLSDLPILADALEEAGCTCTIALACFRRGEKSAVSDYLFEHILGRKPPATVVNSRPMAKCPLPRYMPDPIACEALAPHHPGGPTSTNADQ